MYKKTLSITLGLLMGASLFALLLLVLTSAFATADSSPAPRAGLRNQKVLGSMFGEELTIVQPSTGDILTTTHQPTYTVELDVSIAAPPEVVSVSIDGGVTYYEATSASISGYFWDWGLPAEDYVEHLLIARAGYSMPERVISDTETFHVDTSPPQGTVITVPAQAETTGFTVSWSATDGSGLIAYEIQYRRGEETPWMTWMSGVTETSKVFTETLDRGSYAFRIQAFDKGRNASAWVTETVQVGGFRIYLPLALRQWAWWYQHDRYEPNDTPSQAWGPLELDTVYEAYIWNEMDQNDYYYFTPTLPITVETTLTNIPEGSDYDLYAYYYDPGEEGYVQRVSNNPGSSSERVTFTPVPSRKCYVRIVPYIGFSSDQRYHLKLTYDVED